MTFSIHKRSLFIKYLISYIIVLLIPTCNIFFFNGQFFHVLEQEVISNNANTLDRVMYVVDSSVKQLDSIKSHILMNQKLNPYYALEEPNLAVDAKGELGKYLASNPFLAEIAIYFHGDSFIYTSSSSYTVPLFINNSFNYKNWSEDEFKRDINSALPITRAAEDVTQYNNQTLRLITFISPITRAESNPKTTLLFFVNENYFSRIINDHFGEYNADILILDKNNQTITASNPMFSLPTEEIIQYLDGDMNSYAKVISIDNDKYVFSILKSKETGWKYLSFTPIQQAFSKLYAVQLRFFIIMMLLLLIGIATIYYCMKTNYSPIRNLMNYANKIQKHSFKSGDEIEIVRNTIDYLANQNEKLISDNKVASKDFILERLLKGRINTPENLKIQGEPFGIFFVNPYYITAIILLSPLDSKETMDHPEISDKIESTLTQYFNGYVRGCMDQNKFVLILSIDNEQQPEYKKRLSSFQMHLENDIQIKTTIGVGNIYSDLKEIPLSYLEASVALDYRQIKGNGNIICHSELLFNEDSLDSIPHKELDALKYIIKQGNVSDIEYAINNLINYIKTCNLPLFIARGLCFDMINTAWRSFSELDKEFLLPNMSNPNISLLADYETIDDLTNIVKNMCSNICTFIRESRVIKDQHLISDIASYIQNNYMSCDFSVQNMADHFGMALTHLSQYFKNQTGQTVIDYTTNLRIEKAKDLLISSELNINDICSQVGYLNTSSFIRRFKQLTGLTPGQYMIKKKDMPEA